jgi:hypothetical protein
METSRYHKIYLTLLLLIALITSIYFGNKGYSYYLSSIEDRFFHPDHQSLKSSGVVGHGLGIIGSLMIMIGVGMYMIRKRIRRFSRVGILSHWLEFHIFLCVLGPILVLYHTAFLFGGLVAVSFWSMVAVVASGVIGRYIYLQIPHTIEGGEMSLNEIDQTKVELNRRLVQVYHLDDSSMEDILQAVKRRPDRSGNNLFKRMIDKFMFDIRIKSEIQVILKHHKISTNNIRQVFGLIDEEIKLNRKIDRLMMMQSLFKNWHIAHMPFALLMLIVMIVHVIVTIIFGARWIF